MKRHKLERHTLERHTQEGNLIERQPSCLHKVTLRRGNDNALHNIVLMAPD